MSRQSESTPLLANGREHRANASFAHRLSAIIKADGEPTWGASYKAFIFTSYLNILLIFIPLSFLSHHLNWDAALRFTFSFIAIIPLAKVSCYTTATYVSFS
jgi:Ca2+:H+ antiporter